MYCARFANDAARERSVSVAMIKKAILCLAVLFCLSMTFGQQWALADTDHLYNDSRRIFDGGQQGEGGGGTLGLPGSMPVAAKTTETAPTPSPGKTPDKKVLKAKKSPARFVRAAATATLVTGVAGFFLGVALAVMVALFPYLWIALAGFALTVLGYNLSKLGKSLGKKT